MTRDAFVGLNWVVLGGGGSIVSTLNNVVVAAGSFHVKSTQKNPYPQFFVFLSGSNFEAIQHRMLKLTVD